MPLTNTLSLQIDFQAVDLGDMPDISLSYVLEEPENWQTKGVSSTKGFSVPCTKANDKIFNTYHNSNVIDTSPGQSFRTLRQATMYVNGNNIVLRGLVTLKSATYTKVPGYYNLEFVGGNGDWLIDMQNLTLWDCLSTTPHTFDVATIEASWRNAGAGGYDSDEDHDYVYAPVRYRQPFGVNDDAVNIYALRPSLSIYWMLQRAFRQMGYTLKSAFFATQYFRRLVMPWTWGDFYDINNQVTQGISFKAAGILPTKAPLGFGPPTGFSEWIFFSGAALSSHPSHDFDNTGWTPWHIAVSAGLPGPTGYVQSLTQTSAGPITLYQNFVINNVSPPNGFDNFGLYSFDIATGTMTYNFNPPPILAAFIGSNVSIGFKLSLIAKLQCESSPGTVFARMFIEITINGGTPTLEAIPELSTATSGAVVGSLLYPTIHNFVVPNLNIGDTIDMRLYYELSAGITNSINIISSGSVNVNPGVTGASPWQYDPTTQKWANQSYTGADLTQWQQYFSTIEMTGLQIQLGNNVNFQYYDAFRNKKFLDLLGALVETFDLEVSTNPSDNSVTIEPFSGCTLPDFDINGNYTGDLGLAGYFDPARVVDWSFKQDLDKENVNEHFSSSTRQTDFNFKQDGSDGGQNIYSARYKGIYLNNVIRPSIQHTGINNGIIAGIPGASRYMFPNRYMQGNTQKQNRFFSSVMHVKMQQWAQLVGVGSPAPQMITIFPENINDSSASAVTAVFEPKLAFWAGLKDPAGYGGWRWIGDPASPYVSPANILFPLPFMFSVNYTNKSGIDAGGDKYPILSYSDQLVYDSAGNSVVVDGLMKKFFLKRMAIMANGDLKRAFFRLNLKDILNFEHREIIRIENCFYGLISINGYNPLKDDSCECVLWKLVTPIENDLVNCFPSYDSVFNMPALIGENDLRYAQLLLYPTDLPQIG